MLVTTLPSSPPSQARHPSEAKKSPLANSQSSAKSAWKHARDGTSAPIPPLSTPTKGKQHQRTSTGPSSPLPNESFVVLQDSVVRRLPSPIPSPPSRKARLSSSRSSNNKRAIEAETTKQFEADYDPSPLSHHLRSAARLFNVLSTRTDIDHPLCAECTQALLATLKRQLDETKKERDGYIAFEKEIRKEREREGQGPSKEDADKKIEKLKAEECSLIEQLKEAEHERGILDEELHLLELDEMALELEEAESALTLHPS